MGTSQKDKAETHDRIVAHAAKRLRECGLEGIGVADLMKEAGLTVGGFYKHFPSRDHLVAEAIGATFGQLNRADTPTFAAVVDRYLAPAHRDTPGAGCPFAALAADLARAPEMTRQPASDEIARSIDRLDSLLGGANRDAAILAYCAMVGAVSLARVTTDPALSDAILTRVARQLRGLDPQASASEAPVSDDGR